jgi:hypothetical protein
MVDPTSPAPALGMFALIGFQLVAGWRTFSLSRAGRAVVSVAADDAPAASPLVRGQA